MPADPVAGFFAGFTSIFARLLIGWVAIFLGCALCYLCAYGLDAGFIYAWALGLVGMIFLWATFGGWFILGLAALVTMFYCLWSFVHDIGGKFVFFLMFTASVIYFFPFDIGAEHWMRAATAYAIIAACYWILPQVIAALLPKPVEEIEVAAPLDPGSTAQSGYHEEEPADLPQFNPRPFPHPSDTIPEDFESGPQDHEET